MWTDFASRVCNQLNHFACVITSLTFIFACAITSFTRLAITTLACRMASAEFAELPSRCADGGGGQYLYYWPVAEP